MIKAVDDYQDLLRLSVSTAGNDHRLGANEAPPAVISMFLGDELSAIMRAIETDTPLRGHGASQNEARRRRLAPVQLRHHRPQSHESPFAFTGNKFEFRMLGSSNSIACANIMLNSAGAESLRIYADRLEGADDFESALHEMIRKTIKDHARIVFNGNGYDDAWIDEAVNVRGLHNLKTTPDCMPRLLDEKNVAMLTSHGVFTVAEMESRTEIMLENYCNSIEIEAATMINMARTEIAPRSGRICARVAETAAVKRSVAPRTSLGCETGLIERLSGLVDRMFAAADEL